MKKLFILIAFLLSCGENQKKDKREIMENQLIDLQNQFRANIELDNSWIGRDCDGLLWNSIALFAGLPIDIYQAEYKPGKWHRRPKPACYDGQDNGSRSTTSNDQMTGLMLALWKNLDLNGLNRLYDYGRSNDWVMGEPYPAEIFSVVLRSNGRYIISKMIEQLGGERKEEIFQPNLYLQVSNDFEYHLQTWGIFISGEIDGSINNQMLKRLKENAKKFPDDAFLNTVLGLYDDKIYLEHSLNLIKSGVYKIPSYVRGDDNYKWVHLAATAEILLKGIQ